MSPKPARYPGGSVFAEPPVKIYEPSELEKYVRYFLKIGIFDENEVPLEAFLEAERLCGLKPRSKMPKLDPEFGEDPHVSPLATSGFTFDNGTTLIVGRVMYQNEDGSWT